MFLPTLGPRRVFIKQFHMETSELAIHLRELLISWGYDIKKAAEYTSHSLKATFLSWTAKAGIDRELQRILGCHAKPGDKTIVVHQRDAMAEPLRQLAMVLLPCPRQRIRPGQLQVRQMAQHRRGGGRHAPPPTKGRRTS